MRVMHKQTFRTEVEAAGDEPTITISTNDEDRDGDVLDPAGCVLGPYQRNPVVMFAHDYSALPVGSTTRVDVQARGVRAAWRWLKGDEFADRVRNAFEQGVLRAASVGFRPLASEPRGTGRGLLYTQWELLEWSLVPVPANASAVRALKGLGLLGATHYRCGDDRVLDLKDDDVADLEDVRDVLAETFPAILRASLRPVVAREVARAFALSRGRIYDDPPTDPSLRSRRIAGGSEVVDVDRAEVVRVLRSVLPSLIDGRKVGALIASETVAALRRSRGRVD